MSRLNRTLLILLAVQAGVAGAVFLGHERPTIAREEKVFPGLDPEKVTRIEISGPRGVEGAPAAESHVVLARDGAAWRFPDADGYPADPAKVSEFLGKLGKLEARGVVVTSKKHHGRLQVKDDSFQRLVRLTAGGKETGFYLGSPIGGNGVNLRRKGEDSVLPAQGLRAWDVGDGRGQWIQRDYVKVEPAELWGVRLENAKGVVELEKTGGGDWALVGAGAGAALQKAAVEDLVHKAESLQLEEPAGRALKPEYGLDAPLATVTLTTGKPKEGGGRPEATSTSSYRIGAKDTASGRYYATSSGSEYVIQVAGWAVDPLLTKAREDLLQRDEKAAAPARGPATPVKLRK